MTGWRISVVSQAKGSDTGRKVFHHGRESHTPIEAAYIGGDHSVTFSFCLLQGGGRYTGVPSKLWSGMSRFPEKRRVVEFVFEVHSDGSSTKDRATESSHAT
jgi:hypothetical protein